MPPSRCCIARLNGKQPAAVDRQAGTPVVQRPSPEEGAGASQGLHAALNLPPPCLHGVMDKRRA